MLPDIVLVNVLALSDLNSEMRFLGRSSSLTGFAKQSYQTLSTSKRRITVKLRLDSMATFGGITLSMNASILL